MTREPGTWLSDAMRADIKTILERDHGAIPDDDEINWVSAAEESRAHGQYVTRIIRKLETRLVRRTQTTNPWHRASELLMEANGCYRDGRYHACIMVSRAAVETALETTVTGKGHSLKDLIEIAHEEGLLDDKTSQMANELRLIGNEFAHFDPCRILKRREIDVRPVTFGGKELSGSDEAEIEPLAQVGALSGRLAFDAYRYAVRVCEKLIPAEPQPRATPGEST